jgi:hypothetical protein
VATAEQLHALTDRCEQFRYGKAPLGYREDLALCERSEFIALENAVR